jgi:hypothetical protein
LTATALHLNYISFLLSNTFIVPKHSISTTLNKRV